MSNKYFINEGLDLAFKTYLSSQEQIDSLAYNSFYSVIIRLLVLIYGQKELLNTYYQNDSLAFNNLLTKYNYEPAKISKFIADIDAFAHNSANKELFKEIIQSLIDMFIAKKENSLVSYEIEETFLDLIYTSSTKNPYRISYLYCMGEDSLYFEKYYYSHLNKFEVTKEFNQTIIQELKIPKIETSKPKLKVWQTLSSGNGYVDILLLMSVIVTTLSFTFIVLTVI